MDPSAHPWSKRCSVFHGEKKKVVYGIDVAPLSILGKNMFTICQIVFIQIWLPSTFFVEEKPGVFLQHKEFRVKGNTRSFPTTQLRVKCHFVQSVKDKDINSFCWKLRDKIANFIEPSCNP